MLPDCSTGTWRVSGCSTGRRVTAQTNCENLPCTRIFSPPQQEKATLQDVTTLLMIHVQAVRMTVFFSRIRLERTFLGVDSMLVPCGAHCHHRRSSLAFGPLKVAPPADMVESPSRCRQLAQKPPTSPLALEDCPGCQARPNDSPDGEGNRGTVFAFVRTLDSVP